ncbi:MAG: hypothetical protein P8X95_03280 [Anaerolineales bacterium]|jgi:hypothetical protein
MREASSYPGQHSAAGDAAVEGLFSGMIAGIAMVIYLLLAGLTFGEGPLTMFSHFGGGGGSTPLVGLLLHLGVSGVYGIAFALICQLTARRRGFRPTLWVVGVLGGAYGLVLWFLAQSFLLPATSSPLMTIPSSHLLVAHLIFGIFLGLVTNLERSAAN